MATDQTDGAPPKRGSANFVNIGCTINKSAALRMTVAMNVTSSNARPREAREIGSLAIRQAVSISQAYPVALASEIVLVAIRAPMPLLQTGSHGTFSRRAIAFGLRFIGRSGALEQCLTQKASASIAPAHDDDRPPQLFPPSPRCRGMGAPSRVIVVRAAG